MGQTPTYLTILAIRVAAGFNPSDVLHGVHQWCPRRRNLPITYVEELGVDLETKWSPLPLLAKFRPSLSVDVTGTSTLTRCGCTRCSFLFLLCLHSTSRRLALPDISRTDCTATASFHDTFHRWQETLHVRLVHITRHITIF